MSQFCPTHFSRADSICFLVIPHTTVRFSNLLSTIVQCPGTHISGTFLVLPAKFPGASAHSEPGVMLFYTCLSLLSMASSLIATNIMAYTSVWTYNPAPKSPFADNFDPLAKRTIESYRQLISSSVYSSLSGIVSVYRYFAFKSRYQYTYKVS